MPRLLPALVLSFASFVVHAEAEWPTRIATIEEMKMLTPMRISVPGSRPRGEIRGPAVLRVHVDAEGKVRRAVLVESCGSAGHDEAALHAMRSVRFAPKLIDGEPTEVTLVLPLHLPLAKKEKDKS
jgi:TonB family protein